MRRVGGGMGRVRWRTGAAGAGIARQAAAAPALNKTWCVGASPVPFSPQLLEAIREAACGDSGDGACVDATNGMAKR